MGLLLLPGLAWWDWVGNRRCLPTTSALVQMQPVLQKSRLTILTLWSHLLLFRQIRKVSSIIERESIVNSTAPCNLFPLMLLCNIVSIHSLVHWGLPGVNCLGDLEP